MKAPFPPEALRAALKAALPENDVSSTSLREPQFTYVPSNHAKALNPDSPIVEGMRGAGKSHWWSALNLPEHRRYLAQVFPEAKIEDNLEITQGYGLGLAPGRAPGKDILAHLRTDFKPRHIWRAVIALHCDFPSPFPMDSTWGERVQWVADHPETYETLLDNLAEGLARRGSRRLILFDALDRLADDWPGIRPLAKDLFQLALDMLSTKSIRLKLFVRPDMLQDKEIMAFPDSSKLLARKVELTWTRKDLYALLFQCLANDPGNGAVFRDHVASAYNFRWNSPEVGIFPLPKRLRTDDAVQQDMFHALAGPAMAAGPHGTKRGRPYTWLPNHLVDSHDQVSPRSFCAALRSASEMDSPARWPYAIHFNGLKSGVQQASKIRVQEMTQEDYPWVQTVMEPLKGVNVPCYDFEFFLSWKQRNILRAVQSRMSSQKDVKLLPAHYDQGEDGLLRDLRDLGVIHEMLDGRIQMPDVYRVAFGLGRKGGVKPLK